MVPNHHTVLVGNVSWALSIAKLCPEDFTLSTLLTLKTTLESRYYYYYYYYYYFTFKKPHQREVK
jgi:hypothetical protein